MAISKSTEDSETEYVLRSGTRPRLKREFVFAVKAQAEFASLTGRTRSMKVYSSPSRERASGNKRRKTGNAFKRSQTELDEIPVEDCSAIDASRCGVSMNSDRKKLKISDDAKLKVDSGEIQVSCGSVFDGSPFHDRDLTDSCEKKPKIYDDIAKDSKIDLDLKTAEIGLDKILVEGDFGLDTVVGSNPSHSGFSEDLCSKKFVISEDSGIDLEKIPVEDGSGLETATCGSGLETATGCNLSCNGVSITSGHDETSHVETSKIDLEVIPDEDGSGASPSCNEVSMDTGNGKPKTSDTTKASKIDLERIPVEDESGCEAQIIGSPSREVLTDLANANKKVEASEAAEEPKEIQAEDVYGLETAITVDDNDGGGLIGKDQNGSLEENTPLAKRSTRKVKLVPLGSRAKRKLELKMSKKIASTKFPSNVTELLSTGLLEGLPVKYKCGVKKETHVEGIIKDGQILCYCTSCKGSKSVTAIQFEQHAGSLRKHPSPHIYLENGNTIRDVLYACKTAPFGMLEATIQTAVGASSVKDATPGKQVLPIKEDEPVKDDAPDPVNENTPGKESTPVKDATVCQKCKESFHPSGDGTLVLVCNKCLELEQPEARQQPDTSEQHEASPAHGTDNGAGLSKLPLIPNSSNSTSKCKSSQKEQVHGKLTRKDLRLHKLVFMEDVLPDGTEVGYYARGKRLLEGYKKGLGIFCCCCSSEVSPSQFEAHAGCASRRKPYLHIYTSNGVSLHELSLSLSKDQKFSTSDNDDLCTICADGGDLLCCDGCPRAFHRECVGLTSIPTGDWYCKYCQTMFEREKFAERNANALAAGRVLGIDPIEQISKRCIRIVKTTEADVSVCALCRRHDFSKKRFGPRTVLLCDQCEKEYHVGCLKDHKMADLKELPKGKWFCCADCSKIHAALLKLVLRGSEKLPDSLSDIIKRKHEENVLVNGADLDVQWRLLSGKNASPETRLLLSKAVAIFHDCFDPIIDSASGKDLIPAMVYGRNMRDQEFGGMYCAILTVNSSIVSVGILRIFGQEVAEMPLVATNSEKQGQGYFQSLFSCIERLLGFLNVKNLLLPAADEAESIWTKRFGFKKITPDELSKYRKDSHMMIFEGTSMLHKFVPKCRIVSRSTTDS